MPSKPFKIIRGSLYVISVLWSAYLILISYQETGDLFTALLTVLVLLGSMIFNDLMREE